MIEVAAFARTESHVRSFPAGLIARESGASATTVPMACAALTKMFRIT